MRGFALLATIVAATLLIGAAARAQTPPPAPATPPILDQALAQLTADVQKYDADNTTLANDQGVLTSAQAAVTNAQTTVTGDQSTVAGDYSTIANTDLPALEAAINALSPTQKAAWREIFQKFASAVKAKNVTKICTAVPCWKQQCNGCCCVRVPAVLGEDYAPPFPGPHPFPGPFPGPHPGPWPNPWINPAPYYPPTPGGQGQYVLDPATGEYRWVPYYAAGKVLGATGSARAVESTTCESCESCQGCDCSRRWRPFRRWRNR